MSATQTEEMDLKESCTLIIHLYYKGSWALISSRINFLLPLMKQVIITGCYPEVLDEVDVTNAKLLIVTNKGKDIGGKLVSLHHYLNFCAKTELLIFLHDKISPQTINPEYWFDQLFSIVDKGEFFSLINRFHTDKGIGMVGNKKFLNNEYVFSTKSFSTTNSQILLKLIDQYGLKIKEYNFIAGTIFIARSAQYENFFMKHDPLIIRSGLEDGNVLDLVSGTATHSWERMFSFICGNSKLKIVGV